MQPIPTTFTEGHYTFTQVARHGMLAIYRQQHRHAPVERYEVVRLKVAPAHTWPSGQTTPEHEAYPGAHAWGREGWTERVNRGKTALLSQSYPPPRCILFGIAANTVPKGKLQLSHDGASESIDAW